MEKSERFAVENVISRIPGVSQIARLLGLAPKPASGRQFLLDMLPKQSVGAEIGVHIGDFSQRIMDSVRPRELHLIDPWEHHSSDIYKNALFGGGANGGQAEMDERYSRVLSRFDRNIHDKQVEVHRGYSAEILQKFPDQYFDWVYIDGNHLYDYVKEDLKLSFQKIKPGVT